MTSAIKQFGNYFKSNPESSVILGHNSGPFGRKEVITEGQLNHHVHVVGASGFGKTVLLSHIIKQRIQQGKGLMFIDLKGDRDTLLKFSQYAIEANRAEDIQIFSLTDKGLSLPYNLLSNGSATQLRDRILLSLNWSEEFYKNQASSFLLKLLLVLCWLRDNKGLRLHIGHILECAQDKERLAFFGNQAPVEQMKVRAFTIESTCVES